MNKKRILYAAAFLVGLSLSACSDQFLQDKKLYDKYDDQMFNSEPQLTWFINGLYTDFFTYTSPTQNVIGMWEDRSALTEEKWGISDLINPNVTKENAEDASAYFGVKLGTSIGNVPYTRIRRCNMILEGIDEYGVSLTEEFKEKAKGQAYFLRALQLFDLVRTYGGVPIVNSVLEPSSSDETIKLARSTTSQCVNQILSDLDLAAGMLPADWGAAEYGRLTSVAALAMKSRVQLTYASPLFNKEWDDNGNKRWADALRMTLEAKAALDAAGYGLYGSSAEEWNKMFYSFDNKFCKEAIVVKLLSSSVLSSGVQNNTWEKGIRLNSQGASGGGLKAPKEMIDLFPMADGSRPTVENGYDEFAFFMNRDPRFYRTFTFSGMKWGYRQDGNSVVWAYRWEDSKTVDSYHYSDENNADSPALICKMSDPNADNTNSFKNVGTDVYEYRYAELILNLAECYAATGNAGEAVKWLKEIRKRVGIPLDNNYGLGNITDKYQAIEACLYERRVELAYEGKRFWDMHRWMLYNDDAAYDNNTCAKLGVKPLNGTSRTAHYLQTKVKSDKVDPLASQRALISISPASATLQKDLKELKEFWQENFVLADPETPADNVNNKAVNIDWKSNSYVNGLSQAVLSNNPWLLQTKGWNDSNTAAGTFNWRE